MKLFIPYFLGQQVPKIEYDLIGNKNLSENRNGGKDIILKITSIYIFTVEILFLLEYV